MSRKDRLKARDKVTQKMSKDGLVSVNQSTGEEQRISQRGQDFRLGKQPVAEDTPAGRGRGRAPAADAPSRRRQQRPPAEPAPIQDAPDARRELPDSTQSTEAQAQEPPPVQTCAAAPAPVSPIAPDASRAPAAQPDRHIPLAHKGAQMKRYHVDGARSAQPEQSAPPAPPSPPSDNGHSRLRFDRPGDADATRPGKGQRSTQYAQRFAEQKQDNSDAVDAPSSTPQPESAPQSQPQPESGNRQGRELRGDAPAGRPSGDSGKAPAGKKTAQKQGAGAKLQFAADEKPRSSPGDKLTSSRRRAERADRKLERATGKAERVDSKLEAAREKLPTRNKRRAQRVYDEKKGKATRKFTIEKEVKSQRDHLRGPLPARPVKAVSNAVVGYGHRKLYQVEHENVELKAAHQGEMMAEGAVRTALRFHKTKPYRKVAKLERAAQKSHVKLSYQKALHDNPRLRSSPLSRFVQKRKIKRDYAKAARIAKRAAKNTKTATTQAARAVKAVARFVTRNPKVIIVLALLFLLVLIIMSVFSSCSAIVGGGANAILMSTYLAEDEDIDAAELNYTEWETDLQIQINNAEADHPGYDEYKYSIDDISHNPYELMAFLTAVYQDFTYSEVEAVLRELFAEQYTLTFVEEIEIRTRTRTDSEGNEYEEEYEWYILHINLTAADFTGLLLSRMDAEQLELYGIYMQTKGNRQYIGRPFDFGWLPYVTDSYGWRIHPITGEKDYHKGVDIAVPTGTEILAGMDGVISAAAFDNDYGWYVVIDGEFGVQAKYAHCDILLVSAGQTVEKGQVIARTGNTGTSTGPHLHLEVLKNGVYLNPLYFADTLDDGSSYIPPGSPGGIEYPEYPGEPMGDGSFATLLEIAQAQLGKPYVFGASGPDTFDCSGFVWYCLYHAGIISGGRTTAWGLYQQCTPVSPENIQPGDLVFFHSTYSTTSPTSHIGIYIGNGMMIHAGNPVQYESINSSYWQAHLYGYGRI